MESTPAAAAKSADAPIPAVDFPIPAKSTAAVAGRLAERRAAAKAAIAAHLTGEASSTRAAVAALSRTIEEVDIGQGHRRALDHQPAAHACTAAAAPDRKSTRLNSSHVALPR